MKLSNINQKRLNLLDETVQHYVEDVNRRNLTNDRSKCFYSPISSRKEGISAGCAIGRKLPPELALEIDQKFPAGCTISQLLSGQTFTERIPDTLKDMGVSFLQDLQSLHDNDRNWMEGKLTTVGVSWYDTMVHYIKKDLYTSDLLIKN